jgi:uncharacterized protein involved in tolerance to divalent cations
MEIYEVKVSAENKAQADTILNSLLEKKLLTGGQFIVAPARFLWKGEVIDMAEYVTIVAYTLARHKDAIIEDVRKTSAEEVPMVTFGTFHDLNPELREWVQRTLQ